MLTKFDEAECDIGHSMRPLSLGGAGFISRSAAAGCHEQPARPGADCPKFVRWLRLDKLFARNDAAIARMRRD